jgi:hypothetical protein
MELRVQSDLRPMLADLQRQSGAVAPRAVRKALDQTAKRLHAEAVAGISTASGLSATLVKKRLKRYRASRAGGARLWWGGYHMPLSQISKRQAYGPGTARAGKVSVSAPGLFRATVTARGGSGKTHTGPFVRKPQAARAGGFVPVRRKRPGGRVSVGKITRRGRLPIREIKFDLAPLAEPIFRRLEAKAPEYFAEAAAAALAAAIGRAG